MKIFFGNIVAGGPQNINVTQVTETDAAQAISVQKRVAFNRAGSLEDSGIETGGDWVANAECNDFSEFNGGGGPYYSGEASSIDPTIVHAGTKSFKITDDGGLNSPCMYSDSREGVADSQYLRFYLYIPSGQASVKANGRAWLFYTNMGHVVGFGADASGNLDRWWAYGGRNPFTELPASEVTSQTNFSLDAWHCVEIRVVDTGHATTDSGIQVWVDGTLVISSMNWLHEEFNTDNFYMGIEASTSSFLTNGSDTFTVYLDTIKRDTSPIGAYVSSGGGADNLAQAIGKQKRVIVAQATESDLTQTIIRLLPPKNIDVTQASETDTPQLITAQRQTTLSQVTETETAQSLGKAKSKSITQITETDLAQSVSAQRLVVVTQATENDAVQSINKQKRILVDFAVEVNYAGDGIFLFPILIQKRVAVTQATENDAVQSINKQKRILVDFAKSNLVPNVNLCSNGSFDSDINGWAIFNTPLTLEWVASGGGFTGALHCIGNDSGDGTRYNLSPLKAGINYRLRLKYNIIDNTGFNFYFSLFNNFVVDSETVAGDKAGTIEILSRKASSSGTSYIYMYGNGTPPFEFYIDEVILEEIDEVALRIGKQKRVPVGYATDSCSALSIGKRKQLAVNQSNETDSSEAISPTGKVAQIVETDLAGTIRPTKPIAVAQVTETDFINTISSLKNKAISQASETEAAQTINKAKYKTVEQAYSVEESIQLGSVLKKFNIGLAAEADLSQRITNFSEKFINVACVYEVNEAGRIVYRNFSPDALSLEDIEIVLSEMIIRSCVIDLNGIGTTQQDILTSNSNFDITTLTKQDRIETVVR